MDDNDLDLLRRIHTGDEDALVALHERYVNLVYSVAYRVLGEGMAAQEVTQDTFMRLWEKAEHYDPERGSLVTWMLTITRRLAIDARRRQQRHQDNVHVDAHPGMWEIIGEGNREAQELRQAVLQAMGSLTPDQRQVIELAFFSGLPHSEIARQLDLPLGTVKSRIRRGMEYLRQVLGVSNDPSRGQ